MSLFGDLSDVQVDKPGPWPEGEYDGVIVETAVKTPRSGTGKYLEVKWQISKGTASRVVIQRITISNPSQEAERIGKQHAKQLQDAIGKGEIKDANWLVAKKARIFVGQEPSYNDPTKIFNVFKYPLEQKDIPTQTHTAPAQDLGENDVF